MLRSRAVGVAFLVAVYAVQADAVRVLVGVSFSSVLTAQPSHRMRLPQASTWFETHRVLHHCMAFIRDLAREEGGGYLS